MSSPLCLCHCRHRCHGCRVAAAIAAVAIAAATATAAAVSAATVFAAIATAFWLIVVCPCASSASATVACPRRCCRWLPTPLPLSVRPQTAASCSFRHNHCLCFYHCFYHCSPWVLFKILLRPRTILNIFLAVPCFFRVNRCLCFSRCLLLALFPLPSFSVFDAMSCPL